MISTLQLHFTPRWSDDAPIGPCGRAGAPGRATRVGVPPGSGPLEAALIRARPVQSRQRNIIEAQVCLQLAAVVDHVIEHQGPRCALSLALPRARSRAGSARWPPPPAGRAVPRRSGCRSGREGQPGCTACHGEPPHGFGDGLPTAWPLIPDRQSPWVGPPLCTRNTPLNAGCFVPCRFGAKGWLALSTCLPCHPCRRARPRGRTWARGSP